jgi:riboflavin kinase/FMN adenylyltransferase
MSARTGPEGRPLSRQGVFLIKPIVVEGVVERGQQLGRTLGFPTANVAIAPNLAPRLGVYAGYIRLEDGRRLPGVANIGKNPTTGEVAPRLEFYIFDFAEDIYSQQTRTTLIAFLRDELCFSGLTELVRHIQADADHARAMLSGTVMTLQVKEGSPNRRAVSGNRRSLRAFRGVRE